MLVLRLCKPLIILLILQLSYNGYSQMLYGVVLDAYSAKPMYPVSVVNITTGKSTLSASDGTFQITANIGELIQFSFIGYTTRRIAVPNNAATKPQTITLIPEDYQLREFVFKEPFTKYQRDSMYRASAYDKGINYKRSGGIMSPVSLLAEAISGKNKNMKAFKQDYSYWEQQHFIQSRYTPSLVQEQTGLNGDSLAFFMNRYPMRYDYARAASIIELKMWIRNNYKEWRSQGSPGIHTSFADSVLRFNR